jgi:hypothetical protein
MIFDAIDKRDLVVTLSDNFQRVLIVLVRQIESDYIEAIVEEAREDT